LRYWWVNQNETFRQEIDGGHLWSPKRNNKHASDSTAMPSKPGALLDPAAAAAFVDGYKRFLLTAASGGRGDAGSGLKALVDSRDVHLGRNYLRSFTSAYRELRTRGRFEVKYRP